MKKWIIIAVIVLVIFLIVYNREKIKTWWKTGQAKRQAKKVNVADVTLAETDTAIAEITQQIAEQNTSGGTTPDLPPVADLNKSLLILKIQKTAGVQLPSALMTFLQGLSLADLTMISTMNKSELTAAYQSYF